MSALKALIAGAGIGIAPMICADAQPADAPEVVAAEDWGAVVVDVHYANAEELAAILAEILPPGVEVVPYYPTNSLVFSGSREVLRALLGDEADDGDDASEVEGEADPPAAIGITAHAR